MDGPRQREQPFLARPFVLGTRLILAYPVATIALALVLAGVCCYLTATRLGYQTSRMDLLDPNSNYNRLWSEYIEEFGDEDDAVVVVEGPAREKVVPVLEELSAALAREDLVFALSVVLLGLLMMITRRNAIAQVVGFMSLENGLILAAVGVKGMPLVVEISVAFSILIAFIVIGIFLSRIRERFDSVDVEALDRFRGERR